METSGNERIGGKEPNKRVPHRAPAWQEATTRTRGEDQRLELTYVWPAHPVSGSQRSRSGNVSDGMAEVGRRKERKEDRKGGAWRTMRRCAQGNEDQQTSLDSLDEPSRTQAKGIEDDKEVGGGARKWGSRSEQGKMGRERNPPPLNDEGRARRKGDGDSWQTAREWESKTRRKQARGVCPST